MKKLKTILLLILIGFISSNSFAQKKKTTSKIPTKSSSSKSSGKKYEVGGSLNIDFANGGSSTGIQGNFAYFIAPKTQLGVRVGTIFQTGVSQYSIGGYGRYFIDEFYVGAGLNYNIVSFPETQFFGTIIGGNSTQLTGVLEGGYRIPISNKLTFDTGASIQFGISPAGGTLFGVRGGIVYGF
jgi:hypothetical protein